MRATLGVVKREGDHWAAQAEGQIFVLDVDWSRAAPQHVITKMAGVSTPPKQTLVQGAAESGLAQIRARWSNPFHKRVKNLFHFKKTRHVRFWAKNTA
jgi:hypothetical protein